MITIYEANESNFSGLGLGVLTPSALEIEEKAGGMFELSMTHPMDEDGRWWNIAEYCIIKAPAPMRETPLVSVGASATTVTRQVYKVKVNSRLRLRTAPSTSKGKIIGRYKNGTRVIKTDESGDWYKVIDNLQEGYMHANYLSVLDRENAELGYGRVNANSVNLRTGPSTDYTAINQANIGNLVYIIGLNCG